MSIRNVNLRANLNKKPKPRIYFALIPFDIEHPWK